MDTEKQRQHRHDDVRLAESGNTRSEQLLVMPTCVFNIIDWDLTDRLYLHVFAVAIHVWRMFISFLMAGYTACCTLWGWTIHCVCLTTVIFLHTVDILCKLVCGEFPGRHTSDYLSAEDLVKVRGRPRPHLTHVCKPASRTHSSTKKCHCCHKCCERTGMHIA